MGMGDEPCLSPCCGANAANRLGGFEWRYALTSLDYERRQPKTPRWLVDISSAYRSHNTILGLGDLATLLVDYRRQSQKPMRPVRMRGMCVFQDVRGDRPLVIRANDRL